MLNFVFMLQAAQPDDPDYVTSGQTMFMEEQQTYKVIENYDNLADFIKGKNVKFVDVRTKDKFDETHVKDAIGIDYKSMLDTDDQGLSDGIKKAFGGQPTDVIYIIYSEDSADDAATKTAASLMKNGYKVYVFKGGYKEYANRNPQGVEGTKVNG